MGTKITVKLQPRASKTEIIGFRDGMLWVRVTAPPVDNKANAACIELLAKQLKISKSSIRIIAGVQSRRKTFLIETLSESQIMNLLIGDQQP